MAYVKQFTNPYPDGWVDLPIEETPIDAEALQAHTDAIEGIDNYLAENPPDELKESLTQFKDDGFLPKNLFDKGSAILGYYNTDGSIGSDGNWSREIIKVKPNTSYTISGCSNATSHCFVELDSNQSFISSIVRGNKTITTSSNTHYLGISSVSNKTLSNHDIDTLQIEEGSVATAYTSFAESNVGLTQIVKDAEDNGFLSINLLNAELLSTPTSPLTCVKNADGTFTLNGTPTSNNFIKVYNASFPKGTYKLSGCPSGGNATSKYALRAYYYETSTATTFDDIGDGVVMTFNRDVTLNIEIIARSGQNCNGLVFKPMITKLLDKGYSDYQKYAPSNTELKQSLSQVKESSVTSNFTIGSQNSLLKNNRFCELDLILTVNEATAYSTVIFTVPQGFRPKSTFPFLASNNLGDGVIGINLKSDGTAQLTKSITSSTIIRIHTVYISE